MSRSENAVAAGHTWCKICGITRPQDGMAAAAAGADAVGLMCYPDSGRYIAPELMAPLSARLAQYDLTQVAVFVDPDVALVENALANPAITMLQFSGDESPQFCAQFGLPYLKAVRMQPGVDLAAIAEAHEQAWAFLLDAYVEGQHGGTGVRFDLSLWPHLPQRRLILAGGLQIDNVAAAIEQVKPFGVDVSGGVENDIKGCKDADKITQFMQEVRSVERH